MSTFTPPRTSQAPNVLPGTKGLARRLFRFAPTIPQAVNVYILTDGTVSEYFPPATYTSDGTLALRGDERVARAFVGGGGPVAVTAAEAAILTGAGYTVT